MAQGFFTRPLGLWLLTLAASAALLGLGYELAQHQLEPQLQEARAQLAIETTRANRLAADNQRLEARLAQAPPPPAAARPAPPPPPGPPPPRPRPPRPPLEEEADRLLHRDEAVELLDGRLVLALEDFSVLPRRVQVVAKVRDGRTFSADLAAGGELPIQVGGENYLLVLRRIMANSVLYSLRRQPPPPGAKRGR